MLLNLVVVHPSYKKHHINKTVRLFFQLLINWPAVLPTSGPASVLPTHFGWPSVLPTHIWTTVSVANPHMDHCQCCQPLSGPPSVLTTPFQTAISVANSFRPAFRSVLPTPSLTAVSVANPFPTSISVANYFCTSFANSSDCCQCYQILPGCRQCSRLLSDIHQPSVFSINSGCQFCLLIPAGLPRQCCQLILDCPTFNYVAS